MTDTVSCQPSFMPVVLLQRAEEIFPPLRSTNCVDLRSGGRNEVINVQLNGVSGVSEGANQEEMTSPLTDPRFKHYNYIGKMAEDTDQ
jgi:hypothetical protein